jgi:hypothetical protein
MRRHAVADACYGGALLSMPLAGVGVVRMLTGADPGTGVQPAFLLIAAAWALRGLATIAPNAAATRAWLRHDPTTGAAVRWSLAALGVLAVSGLGLTVAPAPVLAGEAWPRYGRQLLQVGVMVALVVYPALWTRGPRRWAWTLRLLALAAAAQVVYAALQGFHVWRPVPLVATLETLATSNPGILAGSERLYLGEFTAVPRLRGTMLEPIYLGSLLLGLIPWLLAGRRRVLAAAALVALVGTWSRSAWLAAVVALLVAVILARRAALGWSVRRVLLLVGGGVLAASVMVAVVAGPGSLLLPLERLRQLGDTADWSNLTRLYSVQAAWRAFLASPLVGVGWGQYPYHFYALVDLPGLQSQFTWPVVNSLPLKILCETGLVGGGVLLTAVVVAARRCWRALGRHGDPAIRRRLLAGAVAVVAIAAQLAMFSQYNLAHLGLIGGLGLAALAEARRRGRCGAWRGRSA